MRYEEIRAGALKSTLARLREPDPPPGLLSAVLVRTAKLEIGRAPNPSEAALVPATRTRVDRLAWAGALAGPTVVLGVYIHRLLLGGSATDSLSLPFSTGADVLVRTQDSLPATIALAGSLVVYILSLFAIRSTRSANSAAD